MARRLKGVEQHPVIMGNPGDIMAVLKKKPSNGAVSYLDYRYSGSTLSRKYYGDMRK